MYLYLTSDCKLMSNIWNQNHMSSSTLEIQKRVNEKVDKEINVRIEISACFKLILYVNSKRRECFNKWVCFANCRETCRRSNDEMNDEIIEQLTEN